MWNSSFLSTLRDRFRALSGRDRIALSIGAAVLAALVLYQFVFHPLSASCERLESSIRTQESELLELKGIVARYQQIASGGAGGAAQADSFNLFSLLETLANQSGLMDRMESMRPGSMDLDNLKKEDWVEVKLDGVTLKELTEYLYRIRSSGNGVYIKRLSTRKDGDYLNVILQPSVTRMK